MRFMENLGGTTDDIDSIFKNVMVRLTYGAEHVRNGGRASSPVHPGLRKTGGDARPPSSN
jgi:hypothetical protein